MRVPGERLPGARQGVLDGRHGRLQNPGRLFRAPAQDVPQHECRPLARRQALNEGDKTQPDILALLPGFFRVRPGPSQPAFPNFVQRLPDGRAALHVVQA